MAGDFNAQESDIKLDTFCSIWNLKSLVKEPTCFKNPNNPSCIDLFLTNFIRSFPKTQVFETGLFDLNKLVVTVLKSTFLKSPPKITICRSYKNFSNDLLRDDLSSLLRKEKMSLEFTSLTDSINIFIENLNKHAAIKKNLFAQTTQTLLQKTYGKQ